MTKTSSLVELLGAAVDQANDLLMIVDMSETGAARNKKIKITQLLGLITDIVGLLDLKGSTDCSANPNYPAALKGDFYIVSVAGKIGGGSGIDVEAKDAFFATADNAGGTQASVGTSWNIIQGNVLAGSVSDLDDLSDVDLTGLADGDTLVYDSGSGDFIPVPLPGGGLGGTVPDGGSTGQVLTKSSGTDQDVAWAGGRGTSFPVSPAAGDIFWRSDRNIEYYCVSTGPSVWHSTNVYVMSAQRVDGVAVPLSTTGFMGRIPNSWAALYSIYVLDAVLWYTLVGTGNWSVAFSAPAAASFAGLTATSATVARVAVNAVIASSTHTTIDISATENSGTATFYAAGSFTYRLVG